jgi:catechol 2,3-dioxygenase-like lactoylglutathione lyase family enzyme
MPMLRDVSPFLRVPDIDGAIVFFTDTLGFTLGFRAGTYAYVHRDQVAFRMVEDEVRPPLSDGRYASYMDVDDADALYAELKPKLDLLPPGRVCPPSDMAYGQRDFWVIGPDGDIIAFGSPLAGD